MVVIHPLNYYQYLASCYVFIAPPKNIVTGENYVAHFLNVVAKSQDVMGIKLNGAVISGWVSIWNSNYSAVSVQVSGGTVYKINQVNNKTFYAILYGHLYAESYTHAFCGSSPLLPTSVACGWSPLPPTTTLEPSTTPSTTLTETTVVTSSPSTVVTLSPSSTTLSATTISQTTLPKFAATSTTVSSAIPLQTTSVVSTEMLTTLPPGTTSLTSTTSELLSVTLSSHIVTEDNSPTLQNTQQSNTLTLTKCECPTRTNDCSGDPVTVTDYSTNVVVSKSITQASSTNEIFLNSASANTSMEHTSNATTAVNALLFPTKYLITNSANIATDFSTVFPLPIVNGNRSIAIQNFNLRYEIIIQRLANVTC